MPSNGHGTLPVLIQPPLGTAPELATDSRLGLHLLDTRGLQWLHGANGDPYAMVLRGHSDDPYPHYERVRQRGPLHQSLTGSWVSADYLVAAEVLDNPVFGMATADGKPAQPQVLPFLGGGPLGWERADHARLRPDWEPWLGAAAVNDHIPALERVHRAVLDATSTQFDLVSDFARPAVTAVTGHLLGIPDSERNRFADSCRRLARVPDILLTAQRLETVRQAYRAAAELTELLDALPGATETSRAIGLLLATIGVAASINLITNAVLALIADPEQWHLLCESPQHAAGAVAETLRYNPPIQLEARVAHQVVDLATQRLPEGAHIVLLIGATGRDGTIFADPDRFDILRTDATRNQAFAGGMHGAPVASLVRVQAEIALQVLAERRPQLRHAGPVVHPRRTSVTRGPLAVPVSS